MQQRMVNIIYTRVQYVYCLDYLKLTKGLAGIIQFLIEDMLNICLQKTFYAYYVFKFLITAFGKPTPNISPIPVRVNIKEVRNTDDLYLNLLSSEHGRVLAEVLQLLVQLVVCIVSMLLCKTRELS